MEEDKKKIDEFLKEYGELVKKHEVDFINFPMYQPNKDGHWETVIQTRPISTKGQPVKSPFIPQK